MSRVSAAATMISAVLVLLLGFLPSVLLESRAPMVSWVMDPAWPGLSVMAFFLAMVMPFVLIGLFVHQRCRLGVGAATGLLLTVVAMLAQLGFQFDLAFVWPVLAREAPSLLDLEGPMFRSPAYAFVHFWMEPVATVGVLVFGIATFRAHIFPRWSAVLFIIGLIMTQGILFPPLILRLVGSVPASLALAAMGYRQLRREPSDDPV